MQTTEYNKTCEICGKPAVIFTYEYRENYEPNPDGSNLIWLKRLGDIRSFCREHDPELTQQPESAK